MSLYTKYVYVFAICLLLMTSKRKYIKTSSGKPKDYFRSPASALFVSFNVKNGYNVPLWILKNMENISILWCFFIIDSIWQIYIFIDIFLQDPFSLFFHGHVMYPLFWKQLLFCIWKRFVNLLILLSKPYWNSLSIKRIKMGIRTTFKLYIKETFVSRVAFSLLCYI